MKDKNSTNWNTQPSTEEESAWLNSQIDEFNSAQLPLTKKQLRVAKNYIIKNGNAIIAGINSWFYFNQLLYVSVLFVDEQYRDQGLGSELLSKVENEAKALGATLAHLDTFDFQAKDFYLKQGYEIFGVLENCPHGHQRYYLKKKLI